MERIGRYISMAEATRSTTATRYGLKNKPNDVQLVAMTLLYNKIFDPLRDAMRYPIMVTSFFRSPEVNARIPGSSKTSQHTKGEAIDIQAPANAGYTNADLFHYIRDNLPFDQLIWEHGNDNNPQWVHVSYSANGNRRQILRAYKMGGKTHYKPWI